MIDEQTGERAVLWDRDEALRLRPEDVPLDVIGSARLLHVDDVDQEAAIRAARHARSLGIPVTSDLDRMTDRTEELVMAVSCAIFADGLPEQLTGERDHERALRKLRARHDGLLVVTVGQQGAVALDGDRFLASPGFAVNAVGYHRLGRRLPRRIHLRAAARLADRSYAPHGERRSRGRLHARRGDGQHPDARRGAGAGRHA